MRVIKPFCVVSFFLYLYKRSNVEKSFCREYLMKNAYVLLHIPTEISKKLKRMNKILSIQALTFTIEFMSRNSIQLNIKNVMLHT